MIIDLSRTKQGAIRAGIVLAGENLAGQSDTIHGALRNLAFEVEQSKLENSPDVWKEQ